MIHFIKDMQIFLQCKIEDSGWVAHLGDFCLTPARYFNGRTIRIAHPYNVIPEISSKKIYGKKNHKNWLKTSFFISIFLPSILVGSFFKGFAYAEKEMRNRHFLAKLHLTPFPIIEIGSPQKPLRHEDEVAKAIWKLDQDPYHRCVNALVIYSQNMFLNNHIPPLKSLKINKLILIGTRIIHGPNLLPRLDDTLSESKKWLYEKNRIPTSPFNTHIIQVEVNSIKEAFAHKPPIRQWFPRFRRIHAVYVIKAA
jgi:hypothetical protein